MRVGGAPHPWSLVKRPGVISPADKAQIRSLTPERRAKIEACRLAAISRKKQRAMSPQRDYELKVWELYIHATKRATGKFASVREQRFFAPLTIAPSDEGGTFEPTNEMKYRWEATAKEYISSQTTLANE